MNTARTILLSAATALMAAAPALAQEGHPLVGSWHGTWGPDAKERSDVTLILNWDGKTLTGVVNHGLAPMKLERVTLEPAGWLVHFEGDAKDRTGAAVRVVADGKIEDVTNPRRAITGSWTQGTVKGDFKVVHDN